MRKLVVTEFVSLDGVFEAPGPDGKGYKYEGWTFPYANDEFMQFKSKELEDAEIQLLGRVTYEGFAEAWPQRSGDPFSDKFNSMPKYVVSSTLTNPSWNNSHVISENVTKEIERSKEEGEGDILVAGSGQLVRFMLSEKLIDQLNLLVYPVVLGEGKKLFDGSSKTALTLTESVTYNTGVVQLIYSPHYDV